MVSMVIHTSKNLTAPCKVVVGSNMKCASETKVISKEDAANMYQSSCLVRVCVRASVQMASWAQESTSSSGSVAHCLAG